MIEFRQKEFIAPVIAAALIGAGGSAIGAGGGIIAGKKQNEAQAAMQRQQMAADKKARLAAEAEEKKNRELEEKKIKMAEQQEKRLMKLAKKNPQAAAAIKPTITVSSGNSGGELKENTYAAIETVTSLIGAGGQAATAIGQVRAAKYEGQAQINAAKANAAGTIATANANKSASQYEANVKMQALKNAEKDNRRQYNLARKEIGNTYKLRKKMYSKVKEGAGFVKNLGTLAKERNLHGALAGALVAGTVSGLGSYAVDKAIQKDIKKSKILKVEVPEETAEEKKERKKKRNRKIAASVLAGAALGGGTIAAKKGVFGKDAQELASKINKENIKSKVKGGGRTIVNATKDYFAPYDKERGKRRPNYLGLAIGGASLASPALMYVQKKKAINEQINQSSERQEEEKEKTYSKKTGPGINLNKLRDMGENAYFQRGNGKGKKSYGGGALDIPNRAISFGKLLKNKAAKVKTNFKTKVKEFKKHPGEAVLGKVSSLTGGGGRNGVARFADDLEVLGEKTGNKTSQKVGKFMRNNPELALGGSIIAGGLVIKKARNKAYEAGRKTIEKIDPNAYAYAKYGAQPINENSQGEKENNE